jgi:integrase
VKLIFGWGAENELVPGPIIHAVREVKALKAGRSEARESEPVQPVPVEHLDAVLDHVSRQVKGMIQLQELTGMRPGEMCAMRGCDLDTTGQLWIYRPTTHKTQHHGHRREIYLGPKAIEIVKQYLKPNMQDYLFLPADAEREHR